MYEIKHFVVQISMNVILFFSIFYGTGVSWIFLLLSGKLARNRPKLASVCACATFDPFSPLRIVRRFSPVLSRSILIVQRDRDETDDCEETQTPRTLAIRYTQRQNLTKILCTKKLIILTASVSSCVVLESLINIAEVTTTFIRFN